MVANFYHLKVLFLLDWQLPANTCVCVITCTTDATGIRFQWHTESPKRKAWTSVSVWDQSCYSDVKRTTQISHMLTCGFKPLTPKPQHVCAAWIIESDLQWFGVQFPLRLAVLNISSNLYSGETAALMWDSCSKRAILNVLVGYLLLFGFNYSVIKSKYCICSILDLPFATWTSRKVIALIYTFIKGQMRKNLTFIGFIYFLFTVDKSKLFDLQ